MATNKRKDAAALFELIDKSTLKIPKDAKGALKIPAWFSSKTNPPPTLPPAPAALPEDNLPLLPDQPAAAPPVSPTTTASLPPVGTHSPSIRPPQRSTTPPTNPPTATSSPAAANGSNTSRVPVTVRGAASPSAPTPGSSSRTIPQGPSASTGVASSAPSAAVAAAPKRSTLRPPPQMPGPPRFSHPGMLARVPGWIFLAGAGGVIVLVLLIALGLRGLSRNTSPTHNRTDETLTNGGVVTTLTPAAASGSRQRELSTGR
ncbi:MAG: hypothetical protein WCI73_19355, partial [Phycisphaerae bacterium]